MGEIVNLNKARKAKKRADRVQSADANRAKFGRTPSERAATEIEAARRDRQLNGAKLDD